jgi:hypothetical protein
MVALTLLAALINTADASSHREAPAIAQDPSADITDFYAFLNPNDDSKIVFVMNVSPVGLPGAGPNFYSFDDSTALMTTCSTRSTSTTTATAAPTSSSA